MIDSTNANTALATAIAEELHRCGVRFAVISPGSRSTPLAIAMDNVSGIRTEVIVDERSAGFFALGAAQATALPVVMVCTSGTAAANYHPALAEADLSNVPLIVLTADRPPELRDIGAGQTIDQIKLYGDTVRWFTEFGTHAADDEGLLHARSIACRAYAASFGDPRPGPVHVNVPLRDPLSPTEVIGSVTATGEMALEGRGDQPLTRVIAGQAIPGAEPMERLAAQVTACTRGLILAGRTTRDLAEELTELSALTGYPILAEPTSQLRCGHHRLDNVIWRYDGIASDPAHQSRLQPDIVIRFGEMPTSKPLRAWFSDMPATRQVIVDSGYGWNEPTRHADLLLRYEPKWTAIDLIARLRSKGLSERDEYLSAWRQANRDSATGIVDDSSPKTVGTAALYSEIARHLRDGDLVYTSSSLPIRDQECFLPTTAVDARFLANRGANGIDGLISSGLGSAVATGRSTLIICGDVGLQHDIGALAAWTFCSAPIRIMVISNGGGRIFDRLPQADHMPSKQFNRLMRTPPSTKPVDAARLFGMPFVQIDEVGQIGAALEGGSALIEVLADR